MYNLASFCFWKVEELGRINHAFRERISFFNKNSNIGFSEFFVASLVCGSLLSIDKFILKKNG
ncbi:MAG: hypothetical protein Q8776_02465, partial [Sweet potato little leaf phytoplasma]|nr:hypothetical protein [Sweet potato little leaf phytoplasma]